MSEPLVHVSLFSGVGMFDHAFHLAGIPTIAACEIDTAARGVIRDHFPDIHIFTDVKDVTADVLRDLGADPARTVLTAGWPCQDASVAGSRLGFDGDRTSLWREIARILDQWRPAWFVGENVPGLLSVNGGRDFGEVVATLGELGYGYAWRVLDSRHFGVPQRRRRLAIVGHRGDVGGPVEVLLESDGVPGNPAAGIQPRPHTPRHAADGSGVCGVTGDTSHTLTAEGADASEDGTGRGTPVVAFALRGRDEGAVPEIHGDGSNAGALRAAAGGSSRDMIAYQQHGTNVGPMGTLRASSGLTSGVPFIVAPDTAATLTAGSNRPGISAPGRRQEDDHNLLAYIADTVNTLTASGGDRGYRIDSESAAGGQLVAFHENQRGELRETADAGALSVGGGKPGQGFPAVRDGMVVRRLTPRECERLQGLPDDWTLTSNGKPQSDSRRYHQIGNGIAVPVFEWIARRIVALNDAQEAAA